MISQHVHPGHGDDPVASRRTVADEVSGGRRPMPACAITSYNTCSLL